MTNDNIEINIKWDGDKVHVEGTFNCTAGKLAEVLGTAVLQIERGLQDVEGLRTEVARLLIIGTTDDLTEFTSEVR